MESMRNDLQKIIKEKRIIMKKTYYKRALRQLRGLESLTPKNYMRLAAEKWDAKWKTLIAIIMSAQTRDEVTIPIAENLFKKYPSLKSLSHAKYNDLIRIIRSVNFSKTKAKNVIACAIILQEKFYGIIPDNIEKLIELPGVGRKTANVFIAEYGEDALGVDTHVAYISRKLNWTKNKHPNKIEMDL